MESLEEIGKKVKETTRDLNKMSSKEKNVVLRKVAQEICNYQKEILEANERDIEEATKKGMKDSLFDRLKLNETRILDMAKGIELRSCAEVYVL